MLSVDIKKKLGKFNLDVSFEAEKETLALFGASGSGKSMTLKCIAGIETPDTGRIVLDGRVLFDSDMKINLSPRERRVGYLFQQYALFPNMTVFQNISVAVRKNDRKEKHRLATEMISLMRLDGLASKLPNQLSGGQQQRVALARILSNSPELLLLDEPFSSLDSFLKWQLEIELAEIISSYGGTVVYVSHNRGEVYRLCDNVCVLAEGRSERKKNIKKLIEDPGSLSACLLGGCRNITRIRKVDHEHIEAIDWGALLRVDKAIGDDISYAGIRSHRLVPATEKVENTIFCRVDRIIEDEHSLIVVLETPGLSNDENSGMHMLRMELGKEHLYDVEESGGVYIKAEPKDIMLLSD